MRRTVGVMFGFLVFPACREPMIVLDQAAVDQRLDWIAASVPMCESPAPDARSRRWDPTDGRSRWRDSDGTCGGTLSVTSEHDNGITDYALTFVSLCLTTDKGDVTLDGAMTAREEGKPTDAGPEISAFELQSEGDITVTNSSGTILVDVGPIRTEYGYPATFTPGFPDDDNPDHTTVRDITVTFPDQEGRVDWVRDLVVDRTSGWPATMHIRSAEAGTDGLGRVEFATPDDDPLVVQVASPLISSGSVVVSGRGGTEVTVVPHATDNLTFELTLDGEPMDRALDCGAAQGPISELALTLLSELPIP